MKADDLLDLIGEVDDPIIAEAKKRKGRPWLRWGALAACLCLVVAGAIYFAGKHTADPAVQQWSQSISAKDYFSNSRKEQSQDGMSSSASLVMMPYAAFESRNDERSLLEQDGVLPVMPEHPEHSFLAAYNGDGSLYSVTFLWMRRDEHGTETYSDLKLIASPKELHEISDVIDIQLDENGGEIPAGVTVTERDGIRIFARGNENVEKTLAWKTGQGWYQIVGSWNDSYEDMVALLDWFWAHPLSLERFDTPDAETVVFSDRAEQPDAFREQIPDFPALGYTAEAEHVNMGLRDEKMVPIWFEGIYTRAETRIRWTVSIGADADAWAACLGRPGELTEEMVGEAILQKQWLNLFFDLPCMATLTVEQGTAADAWEIVQAMQQ